MKRLQISLIFLIIGSSFGEDMIVKTSKGPIMGLREDSSSNGYFYSFKGIRYAMPPVEDLRFKAPTELEPWTETVEAVEDGHICPQYDIANSIPLGDEDCLFLNVYTPKIDSKKRAVMVHIHGGAFILGGGVSHLFGPDYLMENDIVLVNFNYRLGALGFLTTKDTMETANNGIKDQIMALKWVKENIDKFGGDPNKVTIIGEDAGAASATILSMSPAAQGLFQGVIALSGNALCDQFIQNNPDEAAKELAARLECSSTDGKDIIECISRKTQQDIVEKSNSMMMFYTFPRWFAPNVDGDILPDRPENLLSNGQFSKVPIVLGQTKNGGAFYYRLTINSFNNGGYDDNFIDHKLPRLLPVMTNYNSKLYPITRSIRKRYFVNVDMENEDEFRPRYIEFLTDMLFTKCTDEFARAIANHSVPTYEYLFDYRGQYSIVNFQGEQVDMGVVHGDEMQYVFHNIWGEDFSMSPADLKFTKNIFTPLLSSFAKTSVPTLPTIDDINVSWSPRAPNKNRILKISNKLEMNEDYKKDILKFWNEDIQNILKSKKKLGKKGKDEL
uniref:Esterase FE4like [Apis mellifera] n=1 Tax=Lepeophtheirus salmonis TaxID=72036 RepID=A0A0K2USU3_LEPSM